MKVRTAQAEGTLHYTDITGASVQSDSKFIQPSGYKQNVATIMQLHQTSNCASTTTSQYFKCCIRKKEREKVSAVLMLWGARSTIVGPGQQTVLILLNDGYVPCTVRE